MPATEEPANRFHHLVVEGRRFGRRAVGAVRRRLTETSPAADVTGFYGAGDPGPGAAGEVLAFEPQTTPDGAPTGTEAWRVRYRTFDAADRPVTASMSVAVPPGGGTDRPVVVWVHGAVGVCAGCGPSRTGFDAWYAAPLLAAGVVVAAPDLTGLGIDGPFHPYLHGTTAGRSVLDAARAAAARPAWGAGRLVAIAGHSAGGHAVLWANQLAVGAQDLDVRLAVPIAPVGDLRIAMEHYARTSGMAAFPVQLAATWPAVEPVVAGDVLTPAALERLDALATKRLFGLQLLFKGPADRWVRPGALQAGAWAAAIERQSAGRQPGAAPVRFVHGDDDPDVLVQWTKQLHAEMVAAGHDATLQVHLGAGHMSIREAATDDVVAELLAAVDRG
ncbi:MAG: lipase family protein [Ilumatobacteraceae bacterium]